jgi:hypothetical protein
MLCQSKMAWASRLPIVLWRHNVPSMLEESLVHFPGKRPDATFFQQQRRLHISPRKRRYYLITNSAETDWQERVYRLATSFARPNYPEFLSSGATPDTCQHWLPNWRVRAAVATVILTTYRLKLTPPPNHSWCPQWTIVKLERITYWHERSAHSFAF